MPGIPRANTNLPTLMPAERFAAALSSSRARGRGGRRR
nr:hypothetical protein [Nonomuraea sp. SYSU D8015]